MDGKILKENLKYTGNDELWLQKKLISQGYDNEKNIFLATCDFENNLSIYSKKDLNNSKHDIFK